MAIYYFNAQIISRSTGRSAVAAAAYRAGVRLHDERAHKTHDYSRKQNVEAEIMAPHNAPVWARNRQQLWNAVEAAERRADSQLAREVLVAIPKELTREQAQALVRDYVQEQFVSRGMVADVAWHWKPDNPHAHVMLTTREITPDGFGKKVREWNAKDLLLTWREAWSAAANRALEQAGEQARVDHRSLAEQGVDRVPTAHEGPVARALARKGVETQAAAWNREVSRLEQAKAALRRELAAAVQVIGYVADAVRGRLLVVVDYLELGGRPIEPRVVEVHVPEALGALCEDPRIKEHMVCISGVAQHGRVIAEDIQLRERRFVREPLADHSAAQRHNVEVRYERSAPVREDREDEEEEER